MYSRRLRISRSMTWQTKTAATASTTAKHLTLLHSRSMIWQTKTTATATASTTAKHPTLLYSRSMTWQTNLKNDPSHHLCGCNCVRANGHLTACTLRACCRFHATTCCQTIDIKQHCANKGTNNTISPNLFIISLYCGDLTLHFPMCVVQAFPQKELQHTYASLLLADASSFPSNLSLPPFSQKLMAQEYSETG